MAARSLKIEKRGGKLIVSVDDIISTIKFWVSSISNGVWVLTLTRFTQPRTDPQRKLMWLWCSVIADEWSRETGVVYTKEQVKLYYCRKFNPVTLPNGNTIAGETKILTCEQMATFLTQMQADVSTEFGIQLPDPDDYNFALWAKQYGSSEYFTN